MTIRLVSANAASGRDWSHGGHDVAGWARAAAALDADVIGVQEVDHRLPRSGGVDQTSLLAQVCGRDGQPAQARFAATVLGAPGEPGPVRPAPVGVVDEPAYGVALVSRHPVEEWAELRMRASRARLPVPLPPGADQRLLWVVDEPRAALAAVVRLPDGGRLTVVTTHLSFSPPRAATQLREVVVWARDLPQPVVLLGDLNLPAPVATRVAGLTSAGRHATYPAASPKVQLDHVLLDPHAGPRVLRSHTQGLGGSDHLALVVDLELG